MPLPIARRAPGTPTSLVGRGRARRGPIGAGGRLALATLGCALLAGCVGTFLVFGEGESARFRHRELGYEIAYPSVLGRWGWSTLSLDESDFLVRHRDGSSWALASNCRATAASVELLAAELARATGGRLRERGHRVWHAGLEGWVQRLTRRDGEPGVEIKTVTLRGPRCTYDWILVAPSAERLEELEEPFDAWWQSFEPGPGDRAEEGER
jgi:hypothetical protein